MYYEYKTQKVVPIYEEFKDSGFEVIGVIGGIRTQDQFFEATKNHKYPWIQLAEINDENNIWEKYGLPQSGGSQFFVDNSGKIQAINPEPEELKKIILGN